MVIHSRKGSHTSMMVRRIDHMLIDFICNHKGIIFQSQLSDPHQFFPGKHLSAWIGGIADNDGFCSCLKSFFHQMHIKIVFRRNQRNINRLCSGQNSICSVVFIKRRKDHNFISRIADGHHGAHHGLCTSAGHHDLRFRINSPSNGLSLFSGKSFSEVLCAKGHRILVRPFIGRLSQGIHDLLWRIEIRKSLGKIDRSVFIADPGHPPDHRICKSSYPFT